AQLSAPARSELCTNPELPIRAPQTAQPAEPGEAGAEATGCEPGRGRTRRWERPGAAGSLKSPAAQGESHVLARIGSSQSRSERPPDCTGVRNCERDRAKWVDD